MSDQLFIVLRVCLLALVYLVFLRVLRAVWVELRAESADAAPAPTRRGGRRGAARPAPMPVPAASRPVAAPPAPASAPAPTVVAAHAARLVVVAPARLSGHTFVLDGETTIGRGAGCGVAIDDPHVSKVHARVYPHDGAWLVEDLGSTNGTIVDGAPVAGPTPIGTGGRIAIGEILLELA